MLLDTKVKIIHIAFPVAIYDYRCWTVMKIDGVKYQFI